MKSIFRSVYSKVKQVHFKKSFKALGIRSGFGSKGYGNTCVIRGSHRIAMGTGSWFGNHSEVVVYDVNNGVILNATLTIGNNVSCTGKCRITCAGNITIDDDVLIAPDVFITDHNHGMDPDYKGGYSRQPLIVKDVHIQQGVWLGQRVCVMPGVTIGAHSIVGANSVVTHDVPPYSIAVGAPARVVKKWDFESKQWLPLIQK